MNCFAAFENIFHNAIRLPNGPNHFRTLADIKWMLPLGLSELRTAWVSPASGSTQSAAAAACRSRVHAG